MSSDPTSLSDSAMPAFFLDDEIPSVQRMPPHYQVTSVLRVEMPSDGLGGDWHRYVLSSGPAQITGYHRGSSAEVLAYAQNCAEDFNVRSATLKSARIYGASKTK